MRKNFIDKPKTIEEYKKWASIELGLDDRSENYYNNVVRQMKEQFEQSICWKAIIRDIQYLEQDYYQNTKYELLKGNFEPTIVMKPYSSFLDKCLRKNVLNNECWPEPPKYGWITHLNAYSKIGDLIRTQFIVQYLDGVDKIIERLTISCEGIKCQCITNFQAKQEGYYAAHCDIFSEFEIPTLDWRTEKIIGMLEIQVTTQLKEVIKKLLHKEYEQNRIDLNIKETIWQWDYTSDKFKLNYLGHIMQYLEGTIMEIRDRRIEK